VAIWDNKNKAWPPEGWQTIYDRLTELAVWYAGDPNQLLRYYEKKVNPQKIDYYWGMEWEEETREAVHLPLAGDIAQMSSSLLFGEAPDIQYGLDENGAKTTDEINDRVKNFIDENGLVNMLLEGAEMAAALSGIFYKLDYDPDLSEAPLLTTRTPQQAFPEFRSGRLIAVTFHREVKHDEAGAVWRLFERRSIENGKLNIVYKLFKGRSSQMGREMDLNSIEETKVLNLLDEVIDIPVLGVVYVPNMRPNKLMPGSPMGDSDYRACIGLMDSLDFVWSSWLRDIELGLGQLIVDEGLLQDGKVSKLQRIFVKLNMEPIRLGSEKYEPIKQIQFAIRTDDHMKACDTLVRNIIGMSGYSPQSFGLVEYGQQTDSGTALRIRERKSLLTRAKKGGYWTPELMRLFYQMQLFDGAKRNKKYEPVPVNVILQDSVIQDEKETAAIVRELEQAKAASTYIKVKTLHPGWTEEEVEKEVERIYKDNSMGLEELPYENIS
jgi:hypothetical protein